MKIKIVILFCLIFTVNTYATLPNSWWPQAGQNVSWTVNATTKALHFNGPLLVGSRIATQFGLSPANPYTGLNLKFEITIPSTGQNSTLVLGSDNGWGAGGKGIIIEVNRYQISALKNFDYTTTGNVVKLTNDDAAYQALFSNNKSYYDVEVNVNNTGLITVSVDGFTCPVNYQADLSVLNNPFVLFAPGTASFSVKNLLVKKGQQTKRFFSAAIYIDAKSGNDSNSGISEQDPLKTFNYVNSTVLEAGTKIYLKRGSIWNQRLEIRGSGTESNWITVCAYGSDNNKPKISLTNHADDIGLLITDLDKTSGVAKQQPMNYIEIKELEISNTRLGIYYRTVAGTQNTGFRVSNVTFNNINCDPVMIAINTATDKNAAISSQLAAVKGNLQTINGSADGGSNEYVFPTAIFIGGQTFGNQTVTGNHTTVLSDFEVYDCQFNEAIAGVMSVFYWPFVSGGGSNIWRQLVNKVKINNCRASGIVNGVIAFDGVNGGATVGIGGVMKPDANGWGVIKNIRIEKGSSVPGRTWPNGTTGVILNNSQNMLLDSCEFSEILNQGMPDGCGLDFESNNNYITVQNTKFINNDGHSILLMNGGNFGGNTNIVIQKNLFAGNVKSSNYRYELSLGQTYDGSGVHQNVLLQDNMFFIRKQNSVNQSISLYNTNNRSYVTSASNDLYYLEPMAGPIPVSFLGQIYVYNAELNSIALPVISAFTINSGHASTTNRLVQLSSTILYSRPTYYMASENADFQGAVWETYNSSVPFLLSAPNGLKTIYFKVKNAAGESTAQLEKISLISTTQLNNINQVDDCRITVFPDLTNNFLNFMILNGVSDNDIQVNIVTMEGKQIYSRNFKTSEFSVNIGSFEKGYYILQVLGDQIYYRKKILKT